MEEAQIKIKRDSTLSCLSLFLLRAMLTTSFQSYSLPACISNCNSHRCSHNAGRTIDTRTCATRTESNVNMSYSHQPPSVTRNQIFPDFSPNFGAMNMILVPNGTYCSYTSFATLSVLFPKEMHVSWSKHFTCAPNLTVTPKNNSPIVALLWSSSVRRPFHLPKVVLEIIYTKCGTEAWS